MAKRKGVKRMFGDGKGLFYVPEDLRETSSSILFRDLKSKEDKKLYHVAAPWRLNNLALSPDGRSLAFGMSKGNRTEAQVRMVMPAAGGDPRQVLKLETAELSRVEWTHDGSQLLFSRVGEPAAEMWRISADGGQPRSLGLKTNQNARISLHPDGKHIAYTAGKTNIEVWAMENFLPKLRAAR